MSAVMLGSSSSVSHARNGRLAVSMHLHLVDAQVGAEAQCLRAHVGHQFGTGDCFGEAGIVLDVGREHELTARLIGRRGGFAFDDDGVQLGSGAVDGGREPGRARSDDQDASVFGHYFLRFTGRRLRQMIMPATTEMKPTEP